MTFKVEGANLDSFIVSMECLKEIKIISSSIPIKLVNKQIALDNNAKAIIKEPEMAIGGSRAAQNGPIKDGGKVRRHKAESKIFVSHKFSFTLHKVCCVA